MNLQDRWTQEAEALYQLQQRAIRHEQLDMQIKELQASLDYMKQMDRQAEEEPLEGPGTLILDEAGELVFLPD